MKKMKSGLIALLTDFGVQDFFVASLKAVILSINSQARIVDITHTVPSFNIQAGSFILFSCYRFFPAQTIFLSVVDPGVGSGRPILLVETQKYFFVAPDNGLLTLALEQEEIRSIREVTNNKFFLSETSQTFEGRDKMAPVAAWLSRGIPSDEFGSALSDYEKLEIEKPRIERDRIVGRILYVDKFGNLITNIPSSMMDLASEGEGGKNIELKVKGKSIRSCKRSYSEAKRGETFLIAGSVGLIEVSAREASAFRKLRGKPGDTVWMTRTRGGS